MAPKRNWVFERGALWVMDLPAGGQPHTALAPPISARVAAAFDEVHSESAALLATAMALPDSDVLKRLDSGRRCFVARVEDQIAAYGWLSVGIECVGELEREIHMQAGEAYIWDCVTLPSYRRQRLYSALLSYIISGLHSEGIQRIWIGSSLPNDPSLGGFINAGFQPAIKALYVRIFSRSCMWATGYPGAPRQLVAAARRAFTNDHEHTWGALVSGSIKSAHLSACEQLEG